MAVDRVDLDILEDEFFTLLGPSGSGKTTCLRTIAGFERPDEGRVELAGRDVTDLPPYERDVNTVFQDYALFPHMSVGENVEYGLRIDGRDRNLPAPGTISANDGIEGVGIGLTERSARQASCLSVAWQHQNRTVGRNRRLHRCRSPEPAPVQG